MSDLKPVKVAGKLFWSSYMSEFNKHFNEDNDRYECTLGALSDKGAEALEGLGIKVKSKDTDQGKYIVGKSKHLFKITDTEGNPVDPKEIGNGTEAWALVTSYRHKMSSKFGAAPSIGKIVVTKLISYEPKDNEEDEEEAL